MLFLCRIPNFDAWFSVLFPFCIHTFVLKLEAGFPQMPQRHLSLFLSPCLCFFGAWTKGTERRRAATQLQNQFMAAVSRVGGSLGDGTPPVAKLCPGPGGRSPFCGRNGLAHFQLSPPHSAPNGRWASAGHSVLSPHPLYSKFNKRFIFLNW